jgi:hypothetical protein
MTCKMCEIVQREGISNKCPQCIRDKMLETMPYLAAVLDEMTPKYNINLNESIFDILNRMTDEDSEKLKMAMKYPLGKLRVVH